MDLLRYMNYFEFMEKGTPPPKDANLFGWLGSEENSQLLVIPVPWEATASYGGGTAQGPKSILQASHQLDLEDPFWGHPYKKGIYLLPENSHIVRLNQQASSYVQEIRQGNHSDKELLLSQVNRISTEVNDFVYGQSLDIIKKGKIPSVLGGDHSSPYGLIKALAESHKSFGILHLDAHFDLRKAYEGFSFSHASIMRNVLEDFPQVESICHVGIRDFCRAEWLYAQENSRSQVFLDRDIFHSLAQGKTFHQITEHMVSKLPKEVYISLDVDGLSPELCPSTGTPVPGGFSFQQLNYLLETLVLHNKKIIGFDLCEVAPDRTGGELDENIGARILYKLASAALY